MPQSQSVEPSGRTRKKRRRTRRKSLSWERRTDYVEVTVCWCCTKRVSRKRHDEMGDLGERYKVPSTQQTAPSFCEQCSDVCGRCCKVLTTLLCVLVLVLSLWHFDQCAKHICHGDASCREISAGYECACNQGFQGDGINICHDIDECSSSKCSIYSNCSNSLGSYVCDCFPRYEGDGHNCSFIDYCSYDNPCAENATCVSDIRLLDGFGCSCPNGSFGDGITICTDTDECGSANLNECHTNAKCTNLFGSYTCACYAGFSQGIGHLFAGTGVP